MTIKSAGFCIRAGGSLERFRYSRGDQESAEAFDSRAIAEMSELFGRPIDSALETLGDVEFGFDSLDSMHHMQLRRALLERHSFPFLLTHETYFGKSEVDVNVLSACLAAHTLALTQLDYHMDGSLPDKYVPHTAVASSIETSSTYAVRMAYFAGELAGRSGVSDRLFAEVISPISGFVVARMHEDWHVRTQEPASQWCDIDEYISSPHSRLMASGYWEVMCRAPFVANGAEWPDALDRFVQVLRRLRQVADEAEDLAEDVRAGFVTLPMLIANSSTSGRLRPLVEEYWVTRSSHLLNQILKLVRSGGVGSSLSDIAGRLLTGLPSDDWIGMSAPTPDGLPLVVLVELKIAALERSLRVYR